MEPIYAVKSTYDEDMFYHQVVASKPRMMPKEEDGKKIKFQLPDFGLKDTLMALLVGAAVYMAFGQLDSPRGSCRRCSADLWRLWCCGE